MKKNIIYLISGTMLLMIVSGCSDRKRVNPLDPHNEETKGIPSKLSAVSLGPDVTISWDSVNSGDLVGYNVYRKTDAENAYSLLASLAADQNEYTDADLPFDREVMYRFSLRADAGSYESPLSDSVSIVPGPYQYWITDLYGGGVFRLSYDGMHLLSSSLQDIWPVALAVDTLSHRVWVADATGYLVMQNYSGKALQFIFGLANPADIEWDGVNGLLWISNDARKEVILYDTLGTEILTVDDFQNIAGMAPVPDSGGCWIADSEAGMVGLLRPDGSWSVRDSLSFRYPGPISLFAGGGWVWVADSLSLHKLFADGSTEKMAEFDDLLEYITTDPQTGHCWAILEKGNEDNDVVQVGTDGTILSRSAGFYWAQSIAPNPFNGGCLVADAGNGRIVRLSSTGVEQGSFYTLDTPWDMKIENF